MVLMRLLDRGIAFVSTIILARLLTPDDFGIVAMAASFIALIELISAFSFDVVLIQKQDAGREEFNTAWTFNILVGVAICLLAFLSADFIARFYETPELVFVVYVMGISVLLDKSINIGIVYFRKDLKFHMDFAFVMIRRVCGFLLTITLAYYLRSYWAIVLGTLGARTIAFFLSFLMHSYRPWFSLAKARELFGFSCWLMINNVLGFINMRAADFIIGKIIGARGLGFYTIAFEISTLPSNALVAPINRAIFPGYAKVSGHLDSLAKAYLEVLSAISIVAVPAGLGIAAVADPAVRLLLGEKWLDAIELIQLLALGGTMTVLTTNTGYVFLALGRPRLHTTMMAILTAVYLPALFWGIMTFGLLGAAYSFIIKEAVFLLMNIGVIVVILQIGILQLIRSVYRPILSALVMFTAIKLSQSYHPDLLAAMPLAAQLIAVIIGGGLVYLAGLMLLFVGAGMPDGLERMVLQKTGLIRRNQQ